MGEPTKRCNGENAMHEEEKEEARKDNLLYSVEDNPPWPLCVLLGFQQYLTAFGSTLSVPLILAGPLCMGDDQVALGELIGSMFFMSGVATLLQTTLGVRLPIIQGVTFAFLAPTASILNLPKWACLRNATGDSDWLDTDLINSSLSIVDTNNSFSVDNMSASSSLSTDSREEWQKRLREIQGAICVASLFEIVIGLSGLVSILTRYIGPLTITPTITLIAISLFEVAAQKAAAHWWIAITTLVLIALFSQYLRSVEIPIPSYSNGVGCTVKKLPILGLFPILLAMIVSWLLCLVLTLTEALPPTPGEWGYAARTDVRAHVLRDSKWIRVPYPGQWGMPTVSVGAVFGMLAGVLASMMESIGDYYACARLAGAPPPPPNAINRGIAIEGIGCLIAGLVGTGNGTTSYSENIGAIGITRVGSRRVVITAAVLLILLGCLGKIGALFVTIPDPVVGGMFFAMFGMIAAVGLSNLQFVDMKSSRNMFVVGISIFTGLAFPHWMAKNKDAIKTGSEIADQIISVLLSTSMFVGGFIGFILDVTLPGTLRERGILTWKEDTLTLQANPKQNGSVEKSNSDEPLDGTVYSLPWPVNLINRFHCVSYLPFCPTRDKRKTREGSYDVCNQQDRKDDQMKSII